MHHCVTSPEIKSDQIRTIQNMSYYIKIHHIVSYYIKSNKLQSNYILVNHITALIKMNSQGTHIQLLHMETIHTRECRQSWYRSSNISHGVPFLLYTNQ